MSHALVHSVDVVSLNTFLQLIRELREHRGVVVGVSVDQLLVHFHHQGVILVDGLHNPEQLVLVDVGQFAVLAEHCFLCETYDIEFAIFVFTNVILLVHVDLIQNMLQESYALSIKFLGCFFHDLILESAEEVVVVAQLLAILIAHVVDLLLCVLHLRNIQRRMEVEQESVLYILSGFQIDISIKEHSPAGHEAVHSCLESI